MINSFESQNGDDSDEEILNSLDNSSKKNYKMFSNIKVFSEEESEIDSNDSLDIF